MIRPLSSDIINDCVIVQGSSDVTKFLHVSATVTMFTRTLLVFLAITLAQGNVIVLDDNNFDQV